jgi:hypothetical protein
VDQTASVKFGKTLRQVFANSGSNFSPKSEGIAKAVCQSMNVARTEKLNCLDTEFGEGCFICPVCGDLHERPNE